VTPTRPLDFSAYTARRRAHWEEEARRARTWTGWGGYYHRRLSEIFRAHIAPGQRVLEVGCGNGDLLASLAPSSGVGIEFAPEAVAAARTRHPSLTFIEADAHDFAPEEPFDVIVLSDLVNDLWDVQRVLEGLRRACKPSTRILLNFYSRLWELPVRAAQRLGVARPTLTQNWLTAQDVTHLMSLSGFSVLWAGTEILWPFGTPVLAPFCNKFLVRLWPFSMLALTNVMMARPEPAQPAGPEPLVSVVVPARNEEGNIERIFTEVPEMGAGTELVFVEGHSNDDTWGAIERAIAAHPERRCRAMRQTGHGKGDAVRLGFRESSGEVLMIFDADLTVPGADLPRFYHALRTGKAEFVNGVRLVYPMEGEAMRLANLIANKCFGLAFSWLLNQPIKDTLCGTKALARESYGRIAANRQYFGDFDPFGDFDLLFGASRLNLAIVDLPVRYRNRTYGAPNIRRWRDGMLLARMVVFAARRLKFQ
jgi:SAM-dependent methyltransferase